METKTFAIDCGYCQKPYEYEGYDGKTETAEHLPDGFIVNGIWYCHDCCKEQRLVKERYLNEG